MPVRTSGCSARSRHWDWSPARCRHAWACADLACRPPRTAAEPVLSQGSRAVAILDAMIRRTARALAYLVTSLFAGFIGFAWSLASTLAVGIISVTQLGGPAFLGVTWLTRRFATLERHRAGWVLGAPLGSPSSPGGPGTARHRGRGTGAQ